MDINAIRSLDHTVLLCRDMERACAFYRDVLRLPLEVERPNWGSFRLGGTLLTLRPRSQWAVCDDGPIPPGTASVQLAFRVLPPAIEEWHETLSAKRALKFCAVLPTCPSGATGCSSSAIRKTISLNSTQSTERLRLRIH